MNNPTHIQITYTALEYLSDEAKEYWSSEKEIIGSASNYPDIFYTGKETEKYISTDADWREFIIPKVNNESGKTVHQIFSENDIEGTYPGLFKYYIDKITRSMADNDIVKASKFAGCVSHIIADTAQPAHSVSYKTVAPLCNFENIRIYFHDIEAVGKSAKKYDYKAKILAPDCKTTVWVLTEKMKKLKNDASGIFIPLLFSFVENDTKTSEMYAEKAAGEAAKYVADFLETLYYFYKYNKNYEKTFEILLSELLPYDCKIDNLFNGTVAIDKIPGRTPKEPVNLNIGNGDTSGIALMANMTPGFFGKRDTYVEYNVPAELECVFEAEIGLQCFGENKWKFSKNETGVIFKIYADENQIFKSQPIYEETSPIKIKLPLCNAKKIRIYADDIREDTFDTKFYFPVIANPKIIFKL